MAKTKEILLTKEGLENLKKEYRNLIDVERPLVIEQLQNARAMGDLSENADYDAARNKQAEVEARIKELETIFANAKIIADSTKKATGSKKSGGEKEVKISNTVKFLDLSSNKEFTVKIVSSIESDPLNDPSNLKISNECALGKALIGSKLDSEVTVNAVKPYIIKILDIK